MIEFRRQLQSGEKVAAFFVQHQFIIGVQKIVYYIAFLRFDIF